MSGDGYVKGLQIIYMPLVSRWGFCRKDGKIKRLSTILWEVEAIELYLYATMLSFDLISSLFYLQIDKNVEVHA